MKKRIGAFAVVLLLACFVFTFAQAKDSSVIRVCLSKNSFSAVFRIVNGSYFLQDMATNLPIADLQSGDVVTVNQAGNLLNIKINDQSVSGSFSGSVWAVPEDESQLNVFSYQNTQYRGGISTEIYSGKLLVINRINIEHYLYGVVGKEIGYTASGEALKAQAVVSRSYALYSVGQGLKYDVGTDTSSQVYGGYSAEQNFSAGKIIDAVNATKGKVIYYYNKNTGKKEIIQAFFHSNAGGYTENSENVWNEALPYLKAVPSPEDAYAEEYGNQTGDS